jgi:hypothetical protein
MAWRPRVPEGLAILRRPATPDISWGVPAARISCSTAEGGMVNLPAMMEAEYGAWLEGAVARALDEKLGYEPTNINMRKRLGSSAAE